MDAFVVAPPAPVVHAGTPSLSSSARASLVSGGNASAKKLGKAKMEFFS